MKKNINIGDKVYAWSNERYGQACITECVIEEISDGALYLYAIEDNRAFYRDIKDVLTREELEDNLKKLGMPYEKL